MADDELLASVLAHVGELLERGERVDVDALVSEYPGLERQLRRAIEVERLLDAAFEGAAPAEPRAPEQIGPYRIVSRLGSGGMGTVYLAETRAPAAGLGPGVHVALKVVHPHLLERPGFFKRFLREADAGRRVEDQHVVRTLDADAVRVGGDTVHFIVMEYVEGQTLADLLRDLERVPEALIREIAAQAAAGLAAIHSAGLVHRDLKPENILITPDHRVRLMDLGVARPVAAESALTEQGAFAGSLPYAAPEQFAGANVGPAVDLYALGVTLYELATALNPFRRDDMAAVMAAHREHVPPPVHHLVEGVSEFFSDLVATLMAKAPEARFASAGELLSVLADGERSDWWHDREAARPRSHRLPAVPVRRETALHGREADLTALGAAWESALAGQGRVLFLEGEAGIGKSRLVDAFLHELAPSDCHVLYGSYPPSGGLGGISDALLEHFGERSLAEALAPYLQDSPALVQPFAALVRHEPPSEGARHLSPAAIQTVIVRLMQALAAERPLVWVVDDLHFADEESRAALLSMARAVEQHRVLLVTTSRPGLPDAWLAHLTRVETVERRTLSRLSPREVIRLLQDAFKSEALADKLGARIALKSDGIPFFVFEMIRGLRDGQFITILPDGTHVETRVIDQIEVPSAVRNLIEARLRDLDKRERALLDVAAVLGFDFDPDLVSRVLGTSRLETLQDLASIERQTGVVRGRRGSARFDHHQIQEVIYEDLPPDLRTEYHAAIAEALESRERTTAEQRGTLDGRVSADMCAHYLRGDRGEAALPRLNAALEYLGSVCLHQRAATLCELALALPGLLTGVRRAQLLLGLVEHLRPLGRLGRWQECAREAVRLAEEAGDKAVERAAAHGLGACFVESARYEEADVWLWRAVYLARELGLEDAEARAYVSLCVTAQFQGDLDAAIAHVGHAMAVLRERGDRQIEPVAAQNLGSVLMQQGRVLEARESFEQSLALSRQVGDRLNEVAAIGGLGQVWASIGDVARARDTFEQQRRLAHERGIRRFEAKALGNLGHVFLLEDRLAEALEHLDRVLVMFREIGDRQGEARSRLNLGELHRRRGCHAEAEQHLTAALALSREIQDREDEAWVHFQLGCLVTDLGDPGEAESHFRRCREMCESSGNRHLLCTASLHQGALLVETGRAADGRAALLAARDLARESRHVVVETLARCELAALADGDAADALAAVEEHDAQLDASNRREARLLLFKATGDGAHLMEARRLLDAHLAANSPEYHEPMLSNVRVNREIVAAWRRESGEQHDSTGAERATRVVPRE